VILKPGFLRFVLQIKKNKILVMSNLRKAGILTLALTSLVMAAEEELTRMSGDRCISGVYPT
jgi:hypothetical protein